MDAPVPAILSSEQITGKQFMPVRWGFGRRGLDPDEVHAHLEEIAGLVLRLSAELELARSHQLASPSPGKHSDSAVAQQVRSLTEQLAAANAVRDDVVTCLAELKAALGAAAGQPTKALESGHAVDAESQQMSEQAMMVLREAKNRAHQIEDEAARMLAAAQDAAAEITEQATRHAERLVAEARRISLLGHSTDEIASSDAEASAHQIVESIDRTLRTSNAPVDGVRAVPVDELIRQADEMLSIAEFVRRSADANRVEPVERRLHQGVGAESASKE